MFCSTCQFYTNQKRREMWKISRKRTFKLLLAACPGLCWKAGGLGCLHWLALQKKKTDSLAMWGDLKILQVNNIIYFSHIYFGLSFELWQHRKIHCSTMKTLHYEKFYPELAETGSRGGCSCLALHTGDVTPSRLWLEIFLAPSLS